MKQQQEQFTFAHINSDMHARLKQVEAEFAKQLGRRVALVAYEEAGRSEER